MKRRIEPNADKTTPEKLLNLAKLESLIKAGSLWKRLAFCVCFVSFFSSDCCKEKQLFNDVVDDHSCDSHSEGCGDVAERTVDLCLS